MKSFGLVTLLILTSLFAIQLKGSIRSPPDSTPSLSSSETTVVTTDRNGLEYAHDPLVAPLETNFLSSSQFDFSHDTSATFHGHGDKVCASGCSLSRHPTESLTRTSYCSLLSSCASEAMDAENLAFETLLYFGRQTAAMVDQFGTPELSDSQAATLSRELLRQHASVSIRVVDQQGRRRSWTENIRVPLDRRHVFEMKTDGIQPLVTSGTVKRVGLDHLWTRL